MMQDEALTWDDRDAPYSVRFRDRYFSKSDGREEARAVFLAGNHLPQRWGEGLWPSDAPFQIAELGFGTGLNFLETLNEWQSSAPPAACLSYTAFELYPLSHAQMKRALTHWPDLSKLAAQMLDQWKPISPSITLTFDQVTLTVLIGDARNALPRWTGNADAWFLDGFAPARNPELWEPDLMQAVFDHTNSPGRFSTYTAAGFVRRNLQEAGFFVEKVPGFGGKRERLQGWKQAEKETP